MQKVLTAAEMREVDRLTTEKYGIPSIVLMENAAHAVVRAIIERLDGAVRDKSFLVLCGKGNNGGDGAAIARILWTLGARVHVVLFGSIDEVQGDARANFDAIRLLTQKRPDLRLEEVNLTDDESRKWWSDFIYQFAVTRLDCVVDAIFGTGFRGPIRGPLDTLLETFWTNLYRRFHELILISVDLPSGVSADDPSTAGPFFPDVTVTFTAPKPANVLPESARYSLELIVANIGTPLSLVDKQPSQLFLTEKTDVSNWMRATHFRHASYKNKRGHALIIAGSENYSGAAVLCGNAAIRSGVGLVTIGTPRSSKGSVAGRVVPEVMVRSLAETDTGSVAEEAFEQIREFSKNVDAIAVGSGLSANHESTGRLVRRLVKDRWMPTVLDADALTHLSPFKAEEIKDESKPPLILTPHQGEFLKMLGTDDADVLKDRVAAVREFSQKHHVILVLKGERTLIGEPGGKVVVNPTGNSGLGKAGNGDTLTGVIAGFAAQAAAMEVDMFETVVAAVYIAALAGDIAERKYGKRVMTASDVRDCLGEAFDTVSREESRN